jgi:hypothetical protein
MVKVMNWEDIKAEEYKPGKEKYDVTKVEDCINLSELFTMLTVKLISRKNDEEDRSNIGETSADS